MKWRILYGKDQQLIDIIETKSVDEALKKAHSNIRISASNEKVSE